jgi:hypothetical protein
MRMDGMNLYLLSPAYKKKGAARKQRLRSVEEGKDQYL